MRINHPVIDREFPFPPGETLVSTTDLKGRIVYCNAPFVSVSGFSKDELLGQPHNMIRHPDMPPEAFRDMWETIASGQPWTAMVKNRRKDGCYYWVNANVTPLTDGDRTLGYMSVRTEPSRAEIQAAEALYAQMRAEHAANKVVHALHRGTLTVRTVGGALRRAAHLGLRGQLALTVGAIAGVGYVAGAAAFGASLTVAATPLLAGTATVVVAALVGAALLSRIAVAPLAPLVRFANRMAAGDLTERLSVTRTDDIGRLAQALNQSNVNVRAIVRDLRNEVEHIRQATTEIADGNQNLSSRTESQAASLEQTAASMEEITGNVRSSASASDDAARLAAEAATVSQRSHGAVDEVTRTMEAIRDGSHRIAEIIQVIDGIAFQTNILALNAAVEAARAGDHGRGFAVVAAEVRALAQRTSGAAKEVKQLIESSSTSVDEGHRCTAAARETMSEALATVERVGQVVAGISTASREQLGGISQVNDAVAQMDGFTQQNASMVEQIAAATHQLRSQAATLVEAVQVFRLDRSGGAMHAPDAVTMRKAARERAGEPAHGTA